MIFWVMIIWAKATFFFEQLFPVVATLQKKLVAQYVHRHFPAPFYAMLYFMIGHSDTLESFFWIISLNQNKNLLNNGKIFKFIVIHFSNQYQ